MTDRIFLDVEVRHTGHNADLWARNHSVYNEAKYNRFVQPAIIKYIEQARRRGIDLTKLTDEPELKGVRVNGPEEAIAIHRYYFAQEKIPRFSLKKKKKK